MMDNANYPFRMSRYGPVDFDQPLSWILDELHIERDQGSLQYRNQQTLLNDTPRRLRMKNNDTIICYVQSSSRPQILMRPYPIENAMGLYVVVLNECTSSPLYMEYHRVPRNDLFFSTIHESFQLRYPFPWTRIHFVYLTVSYTSQEDLPDDLVEGDVIFCILKQK